MRYFVSALLVVIWVFGSFASLYAQSASQPLVIEFGAALGMQEFEKQWIGTFGFLAELGALQGLQLRLAVNSGLFNELIVSQIETIFLINFAQKFYSGVGVGVPLIIGAHSDPIEIQIIVIGGVKSPITPTFLAQIEGGLLLPLSFKSGATFRGSIIGILPF